jgi:hypothetical protein
MVIRSIKRSWNNNEWLPAKDAKRGKINRNIENL